MTELRQIGAQNDKNGPPTAQEVADIVRQMQIRLFGSKARRRSTVSDAQMWRILHTLRRSPALTAFRIWLIGSRLQPSNARSDIDILLSPHAGALLSECAIEQALWQCRNFGLYEANPTCVVDPCFRIGGPAQACTPLRRDAILKTTKLFSPRLQFLVESGMIATYRHTGQFSIEYLRPAQETSYYSKLPRQNFEGAECPYLRPAIELWPSAKLRPVRLSPVAPRSEAMI